MFYWISQILENINYDVISDTNDNDQEISAHALK